MTPSAEWILTPQLPLVHPSTTGRLITSVRSVARRLSIKSLRNISAKPTNTHTSIKHLIVDQMTCLLDRSLFLFAPGKILDETFTNSLFCLYISFNHA
jgi:hypothetical protein